MSQEQQVIEPLAKFHTSINVKGQIVLPKRDREVLGLTKDDVVEIIVRKIETSSTQIKILGTAYVVAKLSSRGLITIPEEVRSELKITENSVLEILLVGFHRFEDLISPKGKQLLSKLNSKPFRILRPNEEILLLERANAYYSYSILES